MNSHSPRLAVLAALVLSMPLAPQTRAQEGPGHTPAGASTAPAAPAGPGPIAPNRPGFTNGSATIAPGDALAENGLALSRAPSALGGLETLDLPETNLRIGATPNLEADIVLPDYFIAHGGDHALGDAALGVKYRFYQSKDGNLKASLAPSVSLPTRTVYSSGHFDPTLLLGVQKASGARWSLASNLVLSGPTVGGRRVFTTTPSGSVSYTLTPTLSVYGDAFDVLPRQGPPAPSADAGFALLVNPNVQLDLELYTGLGGAAPVRTLAAGLSFRL